MSLPAELDEAVDRPTRTVEVSPEFMEASHVMLHSMHCYVLPDVRAGVIEVDPGLLESAQTTIGVLESRGKRDMRSINGIYDELKTLVPSIIKITCELERGSMITGEFLDLMHAVSMAGYYMDEAYAQLESMKESMGKIYDDGEAFRVADEESTPAVAPE